MAGGRPSKYNLEIATRICEGLVAGKGLRRICQADDMPDVSTVFRWLVEKNKAEFQDMYTRARQTQAEIWSDEIVEIADDISGDWTPTRNGIIVDHEHINRARLRVDTRKWLMAKLQPRKYGERQIVDGGSPITINITGKDAQL